MGRDRRRNGKGGKEGAAARGRTGNERQKDEKENKVQEQVEDRKREHETAFNKGIQESGNKRWMSSQTKTDG